MKKQYKSMESIGAIFINLHDNSRYHQKESPNKQNQFGIIKKFSTFQKDVKKLQKAQLSERKKTSTDAKTKIYDYDKAKFEKDRDDLLIKKLLQDISFYQKKLQIANNEIDRIKDDNKVLENKYQKIEQQINNIRKYRNHVKFDFKNTQQLKDQLITNLFKKVTFKDQQGQQQVQSQLIGKYIQQDEQQKNRKQIQSNKHKKQNEKDILDSNSSQQSNCFSSHHVISNLNEKSSFNYSQHSVILNKNQQKQMNMMNQIQELKGKIQRLQEQNNILRQNIKQYQIKIKEMNTFKSPSKSAQLSTEQNQGTDRSVDNKDKDSNQIKLEYENEILRQQIKKYKQEHNILKGKCINLKKYLQKQSK